MQWMINRYIIFIQSILNEKNWQNCHCWKLRNCQVRFYFRSRASSSLSEASSSRSLSDVRGSSSVCSASSIGSSVGSPPICSMFSQFKQSQSEVQCAPFFLQVHLPDKHFVLLQPHLRMMVSNIVFYFNVFSLESAAIWNSSSTFSQP